ncbi:MAG: discoidin domain-containing protein [Bacteroidales bacterium]|nr:discoidin domain-containing protein [Bacteroidales bacterium]
MKDFFSKIRSGIPAVTAVVLACIMPVPSCKEQDAMFKQYAVEGGIPYLGAVSGAKARIGVNRLEVSFSVTDPATAKVGIYWNEYEDSVMIAVEPGEQVRKMIDLPEGPYSLFIKSYDAQGNASNPFELITRTVGAKYLATLAHRSFKKKTTGFNSDLRIEWETAAGDARFTDLVYTATDGTEKSLRIGNGVSETQIDDYKQGTVFRRTTYYSPDNLWLDSITPAPRTENELTVDKRLGRVIAYSTQTGGEEAAKFYDDDANTVWQTGNSYPEYITIDLGVEVPVTGFSVVPSIKHTDGKADPRAPTTVRFEVSTDNDAWTSLGAYNYDNGTYFYERLFEVEQTSARYVRFTGVECTGAPLYGNGIGGPNTVKMVLAELNVNFKLGD